MASKFNATIVSFSTIGAAESAVLLDKFPLANCLQESLLDSVGSFQGKPYNARYDSEREMIDFPLVLPKILPSRHYFLFHKPIDLSLVDYKDKETGGMIYRDVQGAIRNGCFELLQAQEQDPFVDPLKRVPYEQLLSKKSPTFPIELLNSSIRK